VGPSCSTSGFLLRRSRPFQTANRSLARLSSAASFAEFGSSNPEFRPQRSHSHAEARSALRGKQAASCSAISVPLREIFSYSRETISSGSPGYPPAAESRALAARTWKRGFGGGVRHAGLIPRPPAIGTWIFPPCGCCCLKKWTPLPSSKACSCFGSSFCGGVAERQLHKNALIMDTYA
jgi:hypothetical protein